VDRGVTIRAEGSSIRRQGGEAPERRDPTLGEGRPFRSPEPGPSDAEVVRTVLAGSDEAYALLVRRYEDVLYRYAVRMTGRPDEASDIVQQAFIKGYRNLRRCRQPEKVGAWLFRIAVNLAKDHLKSRAHRNLPLEAVGTVTSEGAGPDERVERTEIRDEIERALARLTPEQREAFVLKHVEGWSYEEMSERLDVSVPALKMRVHRAREELQSLLWRYR
jgi:RNA polymerase sigma-70 factor (ECF subfamily)